MTRGVLSFFSCSLPLSDLQAYGENLDLWSVPFDINYTEHMAFPKILQGTVLWVSFIISCHNDISLQRKVKIVAVRWKADRDGKSSLGS